MANTVSYLAYANTFGQQMITVNQLVMENNNLAAYNYYKSSGTLFLNDVTTGLSVAANTIVGGNFLTSTATVQNLLWAQSALRVDNLVTLTNTVSSLVSSGPITINSSGNGLTVANNTSLNTLYVSNNAVITNNILVSNSVFVTNNVSVTKNITSNNISASYNISANTLSVNIANIGTNLFVSTTGYIPTLQSNSSVISPVINSTSATYTNTLQSNNSVNTAAISASSASINTVATNLTLSNTITSNVLISTPSLVSGSNVITNVLQANNSVNTSVLSSSLVTSNVINANLIVQTSALNVTGTEYVNNISANTNVTTPKVTVSTHVDANNASAFFNNITAQNQFSVIGNFTVQGTTVYNSNTFSLNANSPTGTVGYYTVNRGSTGVAASIRWNEPLLYWDILDVSSNNYNKILTSDLLSNSLISTSNSNIATSFAANTLNNSIININGVDVAQNTRLSTVEANTIFINGIDNAQNTRLSTVEANTIYLQGALNQTNTNINNANTNLKSYVDGQITYISGIDATQNTRITNLESGLGSNVAYIAGIDASQNTNITNLQTWLASNNTLQVNINATQNTRLSTVEANTIFINGVDATQNTRLSTVEANTIFINGVDATQNTRLSTVEANTIYLQGALNTSNITDYTTISVSSPGIYGGTTAIPVVNVAANGRIISVSNTSITAGATIFDDITTNATRYVMLGSANSGAYLIANTSSSKLYFNPSTGTLSSTIFSSLSDKELKENIKHLENCTDTVNLINPVEFNWKDSGKKSYGVIAQELETILPELINDSDGIKSVEYNSLIAFLIGAVKELSERVSELEKK